MVTEESMDNSFWNIDILGSWIEVGMVMAVILTGVIVATPVIKDMVKRRRSVWPCDVRYRIMHSRIHEFLTELRVKTKASRSSVIQFHNGGNFLDGSSIKRFSTTHESCTVGVSEAISSRQNLHASTFVELLNILTDVSQNGSMVATADLPDCHLKRHMETNHTLVFSISPIRNATGTLVIGYILSEWCDWDSIDNVDDDVAKVCMRTHSRFIEGQLSDGTKPYANRTR